MELLRELTSLQESHGFLSESLLREVSERQLVPLYRLQGLVSFYPHFRTQPPPRVHLQVCRDVCCAMSGSAGLLKILQGAFGEATDVEICEASCLGRCDTAPALNINEIPLSPRVPADLEQLTGWISDPMGIVLAESAPTRRIWKCDPYQDEQTRYGTVRSLIHEQTDIGKTCIERLTTAGLRGMGGAGFPTGRKWELVANETATPKYVICNADESEPGTFKDRVILSELSHLVIEGMLMAGLTVGAEQGIVYIRHEYGRERRALESAIALARQSGVLGSNAAGSGRRFDVEIFVSPGGYILGEETALLEALEDKRGEPRNRPPYPGQKGLWGQPTLINNVETFALATSIIHHGQAWWESQGKNSSVGLKFVSISGDVEQPGVHEVPFGTTINELIALAGGMKDGQSMKAFLPGGASSRFLPAAKSDTTLDFDAVKQAGSMLGTGALIIFAEGRNLFSSATNLVRFFRNESCGKCVPCRMGSEKSVSLLEAVDTGLAPPENLAVLSEWGETMEKTSICGLGQVALVPILSMLEHFPDDVPKSDSER